MEGPRATPQHAVAFAIGLVFAVAYPLVAAAALGEWAPRTIAIVWMVLAAVGLAVRRMIEERTWAALLLHAAPGIVLLVWAALTDTALPLRLLPAAVNIMLAAVFLQTLGDERSIIEVGARLIEPRLPEFTRDYCRKSTVLWAGFFIASAAAITWLAVTASMSAWVVFTTQTYFLGMAVLGIGEFFVRKIYFRHYEDNAIDRAFASLFPAEATAMGRRSAAYIAEQRAADLASD